MYIFIKYRGAVINMMKINTKEILNYFKDKKIGILLKGLSNEKEVSLRSGENVFTHLKSLGLNVQKVLVEENILSYLINNKFDFLYNILHGEYGEDGKIQSILEFLKIPYSGEKVSESAICMNKLRTKEIIKANHVFTADYAIFNENKKKTIQYVIDNLKFPIISKPISGGSSIGVKKIINQKDFEDFIKNKDDDELKNLIFENYIEGKEVTVGLFKYNDEVFVFPIIEICAKSGLYDYEAKYTKGKTDFIIPAKINQMTKYNLETISKKIYKFFNFRGIVRIDYILDSESIPYFLEINTLPGMTELSDIPMMIKKSNKKISDIILANMWSSVKS